MRAKGVAAVLLAVFGLCAGYCGEPISLIPADILAMSTAEVGKMNLCRFRAVVTYVFDPVGPSVIVASAEDPDGPAIYAKRDLPSGGARRLQDLETLSVGDIVDLEGFVCPLMLEPGLSIRSFRKFDTVQLKSPPEVGIHDILIGNYDNRRVRVAGVVRSVAVGGDDGHTRSELSLSSPHGSLVVRLPLGFEPLPAKDSEIVVEGVVAPYFNSRSEFMRAGVEAFGENAVRVVASAPTDPYDVPDVDKRGVSSWVPRESYSHCRKATGEVIYVNAFRRRIVVKGRYPVRVDIAGDTVPALGDLVDVVGFPTQEEDGCGYLADADFRVLGKSESPVRPLRPSSADLARFFSCDLISSFDYHYQLVTFSGRYLGGDRLSRGRNRLLFSVAGARIDAELDGEIPSALASALRDNPIVKLTGVLRVSLAPNHTDGNALVINSVRLLMRDSTDMEVVYDVSAHARRLSRWLKTIAFWCLFPFGIAIIWSVARFIRMRDRARAVAEDRKRMAGELHDTIAQHLSGAGILLFSIKAASDSLPPAARNALTMLEDVLGETKREIRDAILDLQSDDLMTKTPKQLLEMLATTRHEVKIETRLSGIPDDMPVSIKKDLLAIAQEALSNAVKHGKAARVNIVSQQMQYTVPSCHFPDGFVLWIMNDGFPFDAEKALGPEAGHFGLNGMRERARRCGFTITWGRREEWSYVKLEGIRR